MTSGSVIVAPEPAAWLATVMAMAAPPVHVFAPWAVSPAPTWLPAGLRTPWQRRTLDGARTVPGWPLLEAAARAYARGRTERTLAARFALRHLVDVLAARGLPKSAATVYAPSCAALRTFAAAAARGMARVLVMDLPALRRLHGDLDDAAHVHPGCAFLRRYRATWATVARQEAEWVLADRTLVRGAYAAETLHAAGVHVAPLGKAGPESRPLPRSPRRILLAGLATARSGVMEALAVLDTLPGARLLVRAGEGAEPADLLRRPRVEVATRDALERLAGVDAVLAPAWCESYPREVPLGVSLGVPVVATRRAAAFCSGHAEIAPGDVTAMVDKLLGCTHELDFRAKT